MFNEYPYTDFHELNADWILKEMKNLIEAWSQTEAAWNALKEDNTAFKQGINATVASLQNFVNNYFDNLDVQNEINNKLTAMASDGTLSQLIAPYIQAQSNPIVVASTSDMTDHTKLYVLNTTGVLYYYNGSQFVESTIVYGELNELTELKSDLAKNKNLYLNVYDTNRIEIDTSSMTISFLGTSNIFGFMYSNRYINGNEYTFNFSYGVLYYIYYNETNKSIEISTTSTEDMLRVGIFKMQNADNLQLNLIDDIPIYIDGWLKNEDIRTNSISYSSTPVVFDFKESIITFPPSIALRINGKNYAITNNPSISMGSWGYIGFDLKKKQIVAVNISQVETNVIAIGVYVQNDQYAKLNGLPFTIITTTEKNGGTLPDFAVFGDSIVAGVGCSLPFMYYLNVRSGVRIHNYGIGGTGYVHTIPNGYATTIGNGGFTRGDSVNIDYANNSILDRVKDFALTLSQKYILLFGGTNDWASNTDVSSVQSAIEECITTLYDAGKVPIIVLPTPRTETVNDNGVTFSAFVEAIKESADKYNAPLIDCYHNMGLYPLNAKNRELYYGDTAGLHPNNAGHIKIGCRVLDGLKNICINTDNVMGA